MRKLLSITILLCSIIFLGCSKESDVTLDKKASPAMILSSAKEEQFIEFSEEEEKYISDLQKKGKIIAAMREIRQVYQPRTDGMIEGFQYNLIKSLADYLKVDVEIKLVHFNDYFTKEGVVPDRVKTDKKYSYTPDLMKEVDLLADNISILPWREQILTFIKITPVKVMLIVRKGEHLNSLKKLHGKTASILSNSSYEQILRQAERELDIKINYDFVGTGDEMFLHVKTGKADFLCRDSNMALLDLQHYQTLDISMPISELHYQGLAVVKDNRIFASIIEKYIDYSFKTGLFNKLWHDDVKITLNEYLKLLDL